MNNCLVTTLKAATGNKSLLKVGEMVIDVMEMSNPTNRTNKLVLNNGNIDDLVLEVENGEANLTLDSNMSSGWSNKIILPKSSAAQNVYVRNGNYRIRLLSKYILSQFGEDYMGDAFHIDSKYLKHSNDLVLLYTYNISGKVEDLSELKRLQIAKIMKGGISGDIASLANLSNLLNLFLDVANVSGNIASLANLINLSALSLGKAGNIYGDIASLANLTKISYLNINGAKITGDIASLANLTSLKQCTLTVCPEISGDIASLANKPLKFLSFSGSQNITGNIASLANCTTLTDFYVFQTQVTGEVVDFVISQRSNGRTSGSIKIETNGIITFNGKVLAGGVNIISWTASTITNETTSETVNR